ncbi:hypothetical protein ACH9L7_04480 [Haloferax sp. S1W]|uniref:hypothetical protein n=1 Tax=Haloferax sp. S1W TaxID=3377110 RepID=UPI0037C6F45F
MPLGNNCLEEMGDRNYLHICRHCGVVHGTASSTPPEECIVCGAITFSEYELNDVLRERQRPDRPVEPASAGEPAHSSQSSVEASE